MELGWSMLYSTNRKGKTSNLFDPLGHATDLTRESFSLGILIYDMAE
jgi:hypothetical protein